MGTKIKMKMKTLINIKQTFVLALLCMNFISAPYARAESTALDEVAAVVEKEVIMRSELDKRVNQMREQIASRNSPVPPDDALVKQALNSLIIESIQLQMAERLSIRVDDNTLNQQMAKIAAQNNMSLTQFSEALSREGTTYPAAREQIRREMTISQLRQRQVSQRIKINDQEVDRAINNKNKQDAIEYHLANIMIRPTSDTPEAIQDAQQQADAIYKEAKSGRNFAQLAAAHSNSPNAKAGGDLGWRRIDQLPPTLSSAVSSLDTNDVTQPFQDQQGIHIVKVLGKRNTSSDSASTAVTEYHARHILISPSKIRSNEQALTLITQIKEQIDQGADFAKLAKKYSDDSTTASGGGDIGWSTTKKFVPEFAQKMQTTPENTVSAPFQTKFGWHILEVLGSREQSDNNAQEEESARSAIRKQKYEDELQRWLRQIRQEAFVDIKIDQ